MGEDMATEWLTVAANEVHAFATLRPVMFQSACQTARRECTYHGQIVPKILSAQRYSWEDTSEPLQLPSNEPAQLTDGRAMKLISQAAKALTQS